MTGLSYVSLTEERILRSLRLSCLSPEIKSSIAQPVNDRKSGSRVPPIVFHRMITHPDIIAGVLDIVYKDHACEDWADALIKLEVKIRKDDILPALSMALPKFARHKDFALSKEPERWQEEVEKAYGKIPALEIGVRISKVVIDFKRTKDKDLFLKLPFEERVLAESLFE